MYQEINTIFRTALNAANLSYYGQELPIYYQGDWGSDDGAHIRAVMFTAEPDYREVGSFKGNVARDITGYYQVGFFLPSTDKGLDFSLNKLAGELDALFKRQGFISGDIKMEYLSVTREQPLRIDGHETMTCRINFRSYECVGP